MTDSYYTISFSAISPHRIITKTTSAHCHYPGSNHMVPGTRSRN